MVGRKKSRNLRRNPHSNLRRAEEATYRRYVHPLVHRFEFWTENWHKRIGLSILVGFFIAIFTKIYPICTQDKCYTVLIELLTNPSLLFKPFTLTVLAPQFLFTFTFFAWLWFFVFSFFGWLYRRRLVHETVMPILTILLFSYLVMQTSGALTPFVVTIGNLDCTSDSECIRAGYVGEVCTSVYKNAYTTYSDDMTPLTSCRCENNRCVGS